MRRPLIISVASTVVRAAIHGRKGIIWQSEIERSPERGLDESIAELLDRAPRTRFGPRRVLAAIGPAAVQLKRLSGLPSVDDSRLLTALVRENTTAFFLVHGELPITTSVHRDGRGQPWCAAFERGTLDALARACDAAAVRLVAVVPAVALFSRALPDGVHLVGGDDICFDIEVRGGALAGLKRRVDVQPSGAAGQALGAVASVAWSLSRRTPFVWRPGEDEQLRNVRRWRRATLIGLTSIVGSAALVAPTARVIRSGNAAMSELESLVGMRNRVAQNTASLNRVTHDLDQVDAFAAGRRQATFLLRDIAVALPESTAIVSIRIDSAGGAFTVVAPHAADIIPALTDVGGIVAARLVGAVTRETVGGVRLERAAIRFRFPGKPHGGQSVRRGGRGVS